MENVAFVISKNYVGQFKVTFYSLTVNNKDIGICVHLLHGNLGTEECEDLTRFVNALGAEIRFYKIDERVFSGMPKMGYDTSYSAYYKVLLPYYLNGLGKVLFLDCDIIVRDSIKELFETGNNALISCVADFKINKSRKEHIAKIIGNDKITYFNSGVMLFDFSNSELIAEQGEVLEYMTENREVIRWHDQDILNHFYAEKCFLLDEKYNYLTTYKSVKDMFFPKGKNKSVIVHYANWKPWKKNYIGKLHGLYKKYYMALKGEAGVDFMERRSVFAQLKLIFKYLFGR